MNKIKLTRDEEREIDGKLGPDFKKQMNEFAEKLGDLMMEFPMAQGHSKYAKYLKQPFSMMSDAVHLVKRFGMSEAERDKDDATISSIPSVLDSLAGSVAKSQRNCDKYRDVDMAYERFRSYVARENPSCIKPYPLHTVLDALKWVLGYETQKENA